MTTRGRRPLLRLSYLFWVLAALWAAYAIGRWIGTLMLPPGTWRFS